MIGIVSPGLQSNGAGGMTAKFGDVLFQVIGKLERANIHFSLSRYREDSVSIIAAVPGEHWEIDIMEDGELDFEIFKSDGQIFNDKQLNDRIVKFSD